MALCAPLLTGPLVQRRHCRWHVAQQVLRSCVRPHPTPASARGLGWHSRWCIGTVAASPALSVLSHGRLLRCLRRQDRKLSWCLLHCPAVVICHRQVRWLGRLPLLLPDWPRHWPALSLPVVPVRSETKELLGSGRSSLRCHAIVVEARKQTLFLCCRNGLCKEI